MLLSTDFNQTRFGVIMMEKSGLINEELIVSKGYRRLGTVGQCAHWQIRFKRLHRAQMPPLARTALLITSDSTMLGTER